MSPITTPRELVAQSVLDGESLIYETAGGTATAIVLTEIRLIDGYSKTFIASADNSGAATTINTKNLYKPGTTDAPTINSGKAYTVWYDSSEDCFFIRLYSEGTAIATDVLNGKTFSNDSDVGLTGTLTLTGDAAAGDVLSGKTFYNTDAKTKETGTLALTGDAVAGEVLSGKKFYKDDAKTRLTGTLALDGTATAAKVLSGYTFYKDDAKTKLTGTYVVGSLKSIQSGTATLDTETSLDVTITSVDTTKAFVLISFTGGGGHVKNLFCMAQLTSATNLQITKTDNYNSYAVNVRWQVIEFNEGVSVQRGTTTIDSGYSTTDVTISSVDTSKSIVVATARFNLSYLQDSWCLASITSATNVNLSRPSTSGTTTIAYEVITWS